MFLPKINHKYFIFPLSKRKQIQPTNGLLLLITIHKLSQDNLCLYVVLNFCFLKKV